MEINDYKQTTFKPLSNKEKSSLVIILFFMIIVLTFFFTNSNEFKAKVNQEADGLLKVRQPETKIEFVVNQQSNSLVFEVAVFTERLSKVQSTLLINNMCPCVEGLKKTYNLYVKDFKTEALFEYATTIDYVLKNKLKSYIYANKPLTFCNTINLAYNKGIINVEGKTFLHELRKLRNRKAHIPGVDFNNQIADLYLINGINLIETIVV